MVQIFGSTPRGPDGNIWFTARWYESGQTSAKIGRITPSGDVSEFFVSDRREPTGICLGPDDNLWFTQTATVIDEPDHIGRITSAGAITNFPLPAWSRWPIYITPGTGNDLWFTDNIASKIGRITIDGAVTQFDIPTPNAGPTEIVVGPDNLVWFAESLGNKLGRMTQTGTFSEIPLPAGSAPFSIIVGPDQNLWFSAFYGKVIAFIAPDETITAVRLPAEMSYAHHLALGSDGNIWFSNNEGNAIGYLDVASIEAIPDEDVPSLSPVALATLMATIAVCGYLAACAAQP